MHRSLLRLGLCASMLVLCCQVAAARNLALLVGVSGYDHPEVARTLGGPRNDVTIMWRLLRESGYKDEDIVVLADGIPAAGPFPPNPTRPTRGNILQAFAELAAKAGESDFVYVHLSSHGSQQPVQPGLGPQSQPFGFNQVMLPIDAAISENGRTFANGLPDYELGRALDAVRSRAGRVWVVVDMCFGGDATRSPDAVLRWVDPSALGIAATRGADAVGPGRPLVEPDSRPNLAPIVVFSAVGPQDLAEERPFPNFGAALSGASNTLGVFTYAVHHAMRQSPAGTLRDLRSEIMRTLHSGAAGTNPGMPLFTGNLDVPVSSTGALGARRGWSAERQGGLLNIAAGEVQGLVRGSTVIVQRSAGGKTVEIGRARIEAAQPTTSQARFNAAQGTSIPAPVRDETVWVVLDQESVSFVYKLAAPPLEDRLTAGADRGMAAIALLRETKVNKEGIAAEWVPDGAAPPDFRLRIKDGAIWITVNTDALNTDPASPFASPYIQVTDDVQATAQRVFDALWRLARAQNLIRLSSRYRTNQVAIISAETFPTGPQPPGSTSCPDRSFYRMQAQGSGRPISQQGITSLEHCNLVAVKLQNNSQDFVDAAVVYVDARGGIWLVDSLDGDNDCAIVVPPKATSPVIAPAWIKVWRGAAPDTAGREYLVVIAVRRMQEAAQTCFNTLSQPSLQSARAAEQTRSAAGQRNGVETMISAVAEVRPDLRAGRMGQAELGTSAMVVFPLQVGGRPQSAAAVPGRN